MVPSHRTKSRYATHFCSSTNLNTILSWWTFVSPLSYLAWQGQRWWLTCLNQTDFLISTIFSSPLDLNFILAEWKLICIKTGLLWVQFSSPMLQFESPRHDILMSNTSTIKYRIIPCRTNWFDYLKISWRGRGSAGTSLCGDGGWLDIVCRTLHGIADLVILWNGMCKVDFGFYGR